MANYLLANKAHFTTVILLVVRVPVLSEQITVVQPNVSTEGRDRTMAFLSAIFLVPKAKQVVTTAGNPDDGLQILKQYRKSLPSGIAATANATAILK